MLLENNKIGVQQFWSEVKITKKLTFHRWGENDEMVIQKLAIFNQGQTGIVGGFECKVEATVCTYNLERKAGLAKRLSR